MPSNMNLPAKAQRAYDILAMDGAYVFSHGDPAGQWGALFILGAELRTNDDELRADYYQEYFQEHMNDQGKIVNAFGIRQDVHDILSAAGLRAEWIDPGTVGIYQD